MLSRARFRPHLHVEVVPGEGVVLLSDTRQTLLRGRVYELVVPWLHGRTAGEVCERLRAEASPAEVYHALAQLERKDYLCEAEPALPAAQAALWSSQQVAPRVAVRRLAERPVAVGGRHGLPRGDFGGGVPPGNSAAAAGRPRRLNR
jgi:ribosomal protein S12 methylthiotransferase accessory factor